MPKVELDIFMSLVNYSKESLRMFWIERKNYNRRFGGDKDPSKSTTFYIKPN